MNVFDVLYLDWTLFPQQHQQPSTTATTTMQEGDDDDVMEMLAEDLDAFWLLFAAVLVFFMQAGFTM